MTFGLLFAVLLAVRRLAPLATLSRSTRDPCLMGPWPARTTWSTRSAIPMRFPWTARPARPTWTSRSSRKTRAIGSAMLMEFAWTTWSAFRGSLARPTWTSRPSRKTRATGSAMLMEFAWTTWSAFRGSLTRPTGTSRSSRKTRATGSAMLMEFAWTTWSAFRGSLARPTGTFRLEVSGANHPVPRKIAWLGCGRNGRLAVVDGCEERAIRTGGLHVLCLRGGRRDVLLVRPGFFLRGRSRDSPARATVEADTSYSHIVDDGFVVDVGDVHTTEIVHGRVVAKDAVSPVAALVAGAHIAETVIDAAVVSNMRPPVSGVPSIKTVPPAPIPRS